MQVQDRVPKEKSLQGMEEKMDTTVAFEDWVKVL